jgi:hypothetical protein
MSKRNNVNPDHYKVAGRARQGENILQDRERRALARPLSESERWKQAGARPRRRRAKSPS